VRDGLATAVREGGALALRTFRGEIKSWTKNETSPVSEADLAVDALLRERLPAIHQAGWLSEETEDDPARLNEDEVWVVDPIDGTRAYLAGSPDWAVSAALVRAGRPAIAALYAPVTDELFLAIAGEGATLHGARVAASAGGQSFPAPSAGSSGSPRSRRASWRRREFRRWRCALRGSPPARSTAPLRDPTATTGTLRQPIFWCTKPVGC
jgi:fructose-1,6-bisphosphatase/inositol monophosphatase family enzyme